VTGAPAVIGLDLSLRATGVAGARWAGAWAYTIRSTGHTDDGWPVRGARLRALLVEILREVGRPRLVVVEGPAYGASGAGTWDRAGLWWLVVEALHRRELPVAVVPPACRAIYATGRGNADKDDVLDAVRARYAVPCEDDNQADAVTLCAMGRAWLGAPLASVPDSHGRALRRVAWPELATVPT
jgi:crossover junction endodeoxyribonuclease RuvC